MRSPMTTTPNCSENPDQHVLSPDGRLKFNLRRVKGGVLVSRQHTEQQQQVEHTIVFSERELFHHYLDLDPLRFRYVHQYVQLKRIFDELLAPDI